MSEEYFYHGSPTCGITKFNLTADDRPQSFFTKSKDYAMEYTYDWGTGKRTGCLYTVKLNMKNPLDVNSKLGQQIKQKLGVFTDTVASDEIFKYLKARDGKIKLKQANGDTKEVIFDGIKSTEELSPEQLNKLNLEPEANDCYIPLNADQIEIIDTQTFNESLYEDYTPVENRPWDLKDIVYWYNTDNDTYNAIIDYKKKKTRVRTSLLVVKDNQVLLCKTGNEFSLPGGGIEPGETVVEAAKRETKEEVNIVAKNIKETGLDYCLFNDELEPWVIENVPEKYQWYNYYTCLCIGEYDKVYKGKVDEVDEDPEMKNSADWYNIESVVDNPAFLDSWKQALIKFGYYNNRLTEDTRTQLIAKSRNAGQYKDQKFGKNRFERKRLSKMANQVKSYNQIDMNTFFKQDTLEVKIPVAGETDSYIVTVKMEGVCTEIARSIKSNHNILEFKTIIQSLTKVFNTANVYVNCTCDDFKYRFDHWSVVNKYGTTDSAHDPGPGKGIANPKNDKGNGCKHVLLVISNGDWMMKVASVINNYIHYAEEKMKPAFLKIIFPKLYGTEATAAEDAGLIPEDTKLETEQHIIDLINDYGRNRGKYTKGTNKNPVTGTGGRTKKEAEPKSEETKETK